MNPVVALIPARSGSKSIRDKNIQSIGGKPLFAHSIEQAFAADSVDRVIVDTDSEVYAGMARAWGAETPYIRPPELASDTSTDLEVFQHALAWYQEQEGGLPELLVHLRPTYPFRRPCDIDEAVRLIRCRPAWDSVRSVTAAPHTPYKMWHLQDDGTLAPLLSLPGVIDPWNQPRQNLPVVYHQNACIDVVRPRTILDQGSMTGRCIGAFVMDHFHDIDTRAELERVAAHMAADELPTGKTFVFDIDGVIATLTPGNDYTLAQPIEQNIAVVNRLFLHGNRIVLLTARGSATGMDWTAVTEAQLTSWRVQYHELRFGKPAADYYVDDRMLPLSVLDRWLEPSTP